MDLFAMLGLGVDGTGAIRTLNQFTGSAHNAGRAGRALELQAGRLGMAFGALTAYFGARQLIEYADTWTLINSRIRLVADSQEHANKIQEELFQIAQRTRNTMASTSILYTRLSLNASELGRSHQELLDVVETVNAAMLVSGATGVEAAQGMRQLAQALGAGRLQGDEFRTVMEAMPEVARAISEELGVTRGELYKLSREGKISTNDIIEALLKAHDQMVEAADSMPRTIAQSFTQLLNAGERMIGILNQAAGTTKRVADIMGALAENMDKVVAILGVMIGVWISYRAAMLAAWAVTSLFVVGNTVVRGFQAINNVLKTTVTLSALLSMTGKGIIGIVAAVAAAGVGYFGYTKLLEKITADTEKWLAAQGDLNKTIGEFKPPVDQAEQERIAKVRQEIEDMIRIAKQGTVLAQFDGRELARMEIVMDAINKRIEARRELTGDLLVQMERAITIERDYRLEAENTAAQLEQANEAYKDSVERFKRFLENAQRSLGDVLFNILDKGFQKATDVFDGIKQLFFRMLADMAASSLLRTLTTRFGALLGAPAAAAAAVPIQTGAQIEEDIGALMKSSRITVPVEVQQMDQSVTDKLGATIGQFIGPALAGYMAGSVVGGRTSNRALGLGGGAISGAAMGALVGSVLPGVGTVIGAAVGGLAGAIGGLMGATRNHQEELRRHREVLEHNNRRLEQLREALYGETIGQKLASGRQLISDIAKDPRGFFDQLFSGDFLTRMIQLKKLAADLGIEFDGSRKSYEQLVEALQLSIKALTTFGRNLEDIQMQQQAYNKIFGVADTPEQRRKDSIALIQQMAPELAEKFFIRPDMDELSLRNAFKDIYTQIASGQFPIELLGAFADKNELLRAIMAVIDSFDALNEELLKVTTDFPRAMDIIYYEQKYGTYGRGSRKNWMEGGGDIVGSPGGRPTTYWRVDQLIVQTDSSETGEETIDKIEKAALRRGALGGYVALPVRSTIQ